MEIFKFRGEIDDRDEVDSVINIESTRVQTEIETQCKTWAIWVTSFQVEHFVASGSSALWVFCLQEVRVWNLGISHKVQS